ncbi:lactoylglutathione lyase [Methanobrevibacter gottschalkii]|uniref:Lactoylglutathione lyase n=2 Tax=Methanobrevibacter gottschalkii TaxID=190974 RepID=A0A3N5BBX4_9EURY|nr:MULTISPECIES: VOC family protein [Methanobrevibacter]MCQ2971081.1 VOC family protein [archaeon]OEC95844.1 S-D-lactoylglutathione methylglyoxal lyase [Methanobrevibacter sp. A27]RPF52930.1 lactoylglutathione lyase [Methanobrevibacter gottschalkii DSM 11977]SEK78847.1 lactoylglutathione lyase [Methanobrevibacter gottschalkii]
MKIRYATMIVNDMEESVKFYTETLDFTVDEVFDVPEGKITLLDGEGFAGIELIESSNFGSGLYSIGMDVEDIHKEIENLEAKGANIAMKPIKIQVGYMAKVIDPNGINIVLVQHNR